MKLLKLELTALEPLIITSGSSEGMAHSCLDHIPGGMLLGAFANAWIRENPDIQPDDSPIFQKLFLDGSVSWGNGLPLCAGNPTIPAPLCFMREKNMDGLPVEGAEVPPGAAAIFNPLPLKDEENLSDEYNEFLERHCPEKAPRKKEAQPPKFKKLSAAFMDPLTLTQPDLRQVWNTRVALGKDRAARKGMLFGFAAMARDSLFSAEIQCEDDCQAHLAALVKTVSTIHIGHSRSSGYGRIAVKARWEDAPAAPEITGDAFNLLLLSHYFPEPPWENPLTAFLEELESMTGAKPEVEKSALAWEHLEGFNFHWRAWRNSRKGISQGSVFRLRFPAKTKLPADFSLGSCKAEGCGRILVNPPLLEKSVLTSQGAPAAKRQKPAPPPPNANSPQWRILRERALARLAERQANSWLGDKPWLDFLENAKDLPAPSASQRANAIGMDVKTFAEMLKKTPGKQWQAAIVVNPFQNGRRDHLSEVMLILLNQEEFLANWAREGALLADAPGIPGGNFSADEKRRFLELAWKLFKRGLIRSWGKMARIKQAGKEGGKC